MTPAELDIGAPRAEPRAKPRVAAMEALSRLLRAHQALTEQRTSESPYGVLRPARDDEIDLVESTFRHCGVPLPDTLRAIYRRMLGLGNPVSPIPVLAVPFLRAALPDEGFGCPIVGLDAFEQKLGLHRDDAMVECPPFLSLGMAGPLGLTVSRSGLWSLKSYERGARLPRAEDFHLVFEAAFLTFVDQVLLLWANDLAGALVNPRDLDLTQGARLSATPLPIRQAMATLVEPRTLDPKSRGEVQPLDSADLLRSTIRGEEQPPTGLLAPYVPVVGLPYGSHPEVAARIAPGALLRLRPVDDNPHDPMAVEVWREGDHPARIGFVARGEASRIRDLPGGASAWSLRVAGRSDLVLYTKLELCRPDAAALDLDDTQDPASTDQSYDLFKSSP